MSRGWKAFGDISNRSLKVLFSDRLMWWFQVAQSARGSDQDDFLGSVNIPIQVGNFVSLGLPSSIFSFHIFEEMPIWYIFLYSFVLIKDLSPRTHILPPQDIPSTGMEGWRRLCGRSSRSQVQIIIYPSYIIFFQWALLWGFFVGVWFWGRNFIGNPSKTT